ncbi:MAG: hypothetical protein ACKO69_07515 [Limnohabitans sp.]
MKTQDAVELALASSIQKVFAGAVKCGMVKKCVCPVLLHMNLFKRQKTQLIALAMVLVALLTSHINWIKDDLGYLLTIDGKPFDLIGNLKNKVTKATRNCESVVRVLPAQQKYQIAQNLINDYSPPDSRQSQIASVWSKDSWLLVEVEFINLLPAVVLIQNANSAPSILAEGIWSGYTNPHKSAPFIRDYLSHQAKAIPAQLINCFDPQSKSFN